MLRVLMPTLETTICGMKLNQTFLRLQLAVPLFSSSSRLRNGTMVLLQWMEVLFGELTSLPQSIDAWKLSMTRVKSLSISSCAHHLVTSANKSQPEKLEKIILDFKKSKNTTMERTIFFQLNRAIQKSILDTMLSQPKRFQEDLILLIQIILLLPGQCKLKVVLMDPLPETNLRATTSTKWSNGMNLMNSRNDSEHLVLIFHILSEKTKKLKNQKSLRKKLRKKLWFSFNENYSSN